MSPFFRPQSEPLVSKTVMEIQVESQTNLVFDQEYLKTLDNISTPAFKATQQEFNDADNQNVITTRAWMKQNIHKKVRLHFRSARDVDKLWNSFKTMDLHSKYLSLNQRRGSKDARCS
eukprot:TRINITY_DN3299_c0_g3_i5.p2 TRINITY_DN3299_c0_g3~~TRINITY_DN3299_c0_g3_i5.p2  ORF type:complete len:118 (+),score=9.58 TRINITY_DN3299_c0_g3_i5:58-411(+)